MLNLHQLLNFIHKDYLKKNPIKHVIRIRFSDIFDKNSIGGFVKSLST